LLHDTAWAQGEAGNAEQGGAGLTKEEEVERLCADRVANGDAFGAEGLADFPWASAEDGRGVFADPVAQLDQPLLNGDRDAAIGLGGNDKQQVAVFAQDVAKR